MVGNDKSVHGGITTVINQLKSYNWKEKKIKLDFIPTYIDKNILIKAIFFLIAYVKIFFYILIKRPDIIHIHMSYKGSFTRAYFIKNLSSFFKVKSVIHLHGSEFKKWYEQECNIKKKEKVKRFLRECDAIIVLGKEWKKRILEIEPLSKVIVINNTVKIPNEKSQYNNKKFNVLFLGVLIKRKGVYELIQAINELNKKINLDNVKFFIAGNGIEEETLKLETKKNKIDKYIDFMGWINEEKKKELLKKSQLLVLPSYNEGLPMAILEAISYGIPVVATNVGDVSEAVENGKNGYLIEIGNVKQLTETMHKMIKTSKEEWEKFSNYSRNLAIHKFSDNKYFRNIERLYKKFQMNQ